VDASTTTHAEVRAATTAAATRKNTAATTRAATTRAATTAAAPTRATPAATNRSTSATAREPDGTTHPDGHTGGPREPKYPDVRGRRGKEAAADGRLDVAGGTRGGDGGDGGAPNLGGEYSPGDPAGPQDPRQTGAMETTDTEHRTDDTGISSNRRPDGSTGTGGAAGKGALGVARARVQWPSSAKTAALRAQNHQGGGQAKVGEDDVGAGESAIARDRRARVARKRPASWAAGAACAYRERVARSESGWGSRARECLRSSRIKFKNIRKRKKI